MIYLVTQMEYFDFCRFDMKIPNVVKIPKSPVFPCYNCDCTLLIVLAVGEKSRCVFLHLPLGPIVASHYRATHTEVDTISMDCSGAPIQIAFHPQLAPYYVTGG